MQSSSCVSSSIVSIPSVTKINFNWRCYARNYGYVLQVISAIFTIRLNFVCLLPVLNACSAIQLLSLLRQMELLPGQPLIFICNSYAICNNMIRLLKSHLQTKLFK